MATAYGPGARGNAVTTDRLGTTGGQGTTKWLGGLVAVLCVALDLLANLLVQAMSGRWVPDVINVFAVGTAAVALVTTLGLHLFDRLEAKVDRLSESLAGRMDELTQRVGDRNSGFVEGYLAGQGRDGAVVPLAQRGPAWRSLNDAAREAPQ